MIEFGLAHGALSLCVYHSEGTKTFNFPNAVAFGNLTQREYIDLTLTSYLSKFMYTLLVFIVCTQEYTFTNTRYGISCNNISNFILQLP